MSDLDIFRERFLYDEGRLLFKKRIGGRAKKGKEVGYINDRGYRMTEVRCGDRVINISVHRIVFALHHGYLPDTIDHINGDRLDNRIENLRAVTSSENCHNSKLPKNNVSGFKGVDFVPGCKKWQSRIGYRGKRYRLGYYESPDDAYKARLDFVKLHDIYDRSVVLTGSRTPRRR